MMYELSHCSGDIIINTGSLEFVSRVLHEHVCESCLIDLPHYFSEMSIEDQVEELLLTQCGAEWMLEGNFENV